MQIDPLARAYELTQTMAVAMEAGDWQFASSLAEERSPLLMALAPTQSDAALATIRAIQAIDERIMGQAHVENVTNLACRRALTYRGVSHICFPTDTQDFTLKDDEKTKGQRWTNRQRTRRVRMINSNDEDVSPALSRWPI